MIYRVYCFPDSQAFAAALDVQRPLDCMPVGPAGDPPTGFWVLATWHDETTEVSQWENARRNPESAPVWWSGIPFSAAEPPTVVISAADMPPLSRLQFMLLLDATGISEAAVEAAIAAIPERETKRIAELHWKNAREFERLNPLLILIADSMGITETQMNHLWLQALGKSGE